MWSMNSQKGYNTRCRCTTQQKYYVEPAHMNSLSKKIIIYICPLFKYIILTDYLKINSNIPIHKNGFKHCISYVNIFLILFELNKAAQTNHDQSNGLKTTGLNTWDNTEVECLKKTGLLKC